MIKYSVKKPFTVLVLVIGILMLAAVSLSQMTTNLLPEISTPYLMIITTYPGASPEKVETEVTDPLEGVLSTVTDVKNITSTSAENYSMITMEFLEETDMDSALVKVNTQIDTVEPYLPERAGTPTIMEISLDMLATMYVAVERDGMDIYELTDYVSDEVMPYFQRQEGVASVTAIGLVEKTLEIRLDKDKVDKLNDKLAGYVSDELDEAQEELDKAQNEIDKGKRDLDNGERELSENRDKTSQELASATKGLNEALATQSSYNANLNSLKAQQMALTAEKQAYEDAGVRTAHDGLNQLFGSIPTMLGQLESGKSQASSGITQAQAAVDKISAAKNTVDGFITANNYPAASVASLNATLEELGFPAQVRIDTSSPAMATATATAVQDALTQALAQANSGLNTARAAQSSVGGISTVATAYPMDVADAALHPEKVTNAINLMNYMNQMAKSSGKEAPFSEEVISNLTTDNIKKLYDAVDVRLTQIDTELANLSTEQMAAQAAIDQVNAGVSEAMGRYEEVEAGKITAAAEFGSAAAQISYGRSALEDAQKQLDDAVETYKKSRDEALKAANLDQLLSLDTLSQLISAQNFSMPAGYINDANEDKWLVKVGTEIEDTDELDDMVLADIDGLGKIKLTDVADIVVTDNAADSYARMNGEPAVLLSVYKASTAGTSTVSKTCNKAVDQLMADTEGLHITALMDQGEYIAFFINNVVTNMVQGAIFAILVLVLFFRSAKPTLVVAFSIPFSVLLAVLVMYFTDISINIMSLSGLSLGIGMLVDNSIVVIENIYRIRAKGVASPRAAVQGTRQVSGAIISSTLTTICVFLPMIFTSGMVRQLMVPFALTITYSLCASLLVAMTVSPAMGSTLLRNTIPRQSVSSKKIQDMYGKLLEWCLKFKIVPIAVAGGLLALAVVLVLSMGYIFMPDMSSKQLLVTVAMDEDMSMDECYAKADEITDTILTVDGVEQVGSMTNMESAFTGLMAAADNDFRNYSIYLVLSDDIDKLNELSTVQENVRTVLADVEGCESTVEQSGAGDMMALMSSGLSLNIYGDDTEKLVEISEDMVEMASDIEGFENVSNGQEESDEVIHVVIDKNKAMAAGFPVAQIYSEISGKLTVDKDATSIITDGDSMDVTVIDEMDPLTVENLMSMEFEYKKQGMDGEEEVTVYHLRDFARIVRETGVAEVLRENGTHMITVSADTMEGYNTTRLSEQMMSKIDSYELPSGYTIELGGEAEQVRDMIIQMAKLMALGLALVYLVMVAQFQSLLSPFIILFTVPLAFTGGLFGLVIFGQQMSIVPLMGFLVLMGTVVNNGIVFVDYTNQLRIAGLEKKEALIATGKTRMRPILMTALTTILAMSNLVFSQDLAAGISRGMAVVVAAGLLYATLMTLFIVPVLYDVFFRGQPHNIDVGDDLDEVPDEISEILS